MVLELILPLQSVPDGTVYVGAKDGNLHAINSNGTLKWSYSTGDIITSSATISSDGTIFTGSWNGNLYAIAPDGTLKWKQSLSRFPILSSPAIGSQGSVYVGSTDWKMYSVGK